MANEIQNHDDHPAEGSIQDLYLSRLEAAEKADRRYEQLVQSGVTDPAEIQRLEGLRQTMHDIAARYGRDHGLLPEAPETPEEP